jgi:uncharacterized protein (UPF0335 family)
MTDTMTETTIETGGSISATRLKGFIERIERLEEQKANYMEDIKEVYKEAGSAGFDVATMKTVVKLRKVDLKKLEEKEYLLDLYRKALGL